MEEAVAPSARPETSLWPLYSYRISWHCQLVTKIFMSLTYDINKQFPFKVWLIDFPWEVKRTSRSRSPAFDCVGIARSTWSGTSSTYFFPPLSGGGRSTSKSHRYGESGPIVSRKLTGSPLSDQRHDLLTNLVEMLSDSSMSSLHKLKKKSVVNSNVQVCAKWWIDESDEDLRRLECRHWEVIYVLSL